MSLDIQVPLMETPKVHGPDLPVKVFLISVCHLSRRKVGDLGGWSVLGPVLQVSALGRSIPAPRPLHLLPPLSGTFFPLTSLLASSSS